MNQSEKETYEGAVAALRGRLDPISLTLAAQDFRHLVQGEDKKVADFIHWLEHQPLDVRICPLRCAMN